MKTAPILLTALLALFLEGCGLSRSSQAILYKSECHLKTGSVDLNTNRDVTINKDCSITIEGAKGGSDADVE